MADAPLIIVTGAARRVGRAIALELAGAGCDLVLTCRRSVDDLAHTAQSVREVATRKGHAVECQTVQCDFASPGGWQPVIDRVQNRQRVDGIVHNASSYAPSAFGEITEDAVLGHFRVNALAPLMITQALADLLRESTISGGASVICMGDIHALGRPRRDYAAYAMSKAALHQVIHSLARDLAPAVRVNGIAPGVIAWPDDAGPEERATYESRTPLKRSGSPTDAARLVRWLLFEAPFVTGEIIRVDGGRWLV